VRTCALPISAAGHPASSFELLGSEAKVRDAQALTDIEYNRHGSPRNFSVEVDAHGQTFASRIGIDLLAIGQVLLDLAIIGHEVSGVVRRTERDVSRLGLRAVTVRLRAVHALEAVDVPSIAAAGRSVVESLADDLAGTVVDPGELERDVDELGVRRSIRCKSLVLRQE